MIRGYLATQVVEYLLNFNLTERQIWMSCNGESLDDAEGRIGRSSHLNENSRQFAKALANFIQEQRDKWSETHLSSQTDSFDKWSGQPDALSFCIWTPMILQAIETARPFPDDHYAKKQIKLLDDLNAGYMAGLTFEEIQELHPKGFASRSRNNLLYRWPGAGGEAYVDVINRLRPVIIELERVTDHLLLITHEAIVRVLLAYFLGLPHDGLAKLELAKDSVFCIQPLAYGVYVRAYCYCRKGDTFLSISSYGESRTN